MRRHEETRDLGSDFWYSSTPVFDASIYDGILLCVDCVLTQNVTEEYNGHTRDRARFAKEADIELCFSNNLFSRRIQHRRFV